MHSHELEDLTLILIRDAGEEEMWIDRWALSYPVVRTAEVSAAQDIPAWQRQIQTAFDHLPGRNAAVVAHGAGVSAWLAWLYTADTATLKRIKNMMLVSPLQNAFPDDEVHTLQRVRACCPCALVIGQDDPDSPYGWAQEKAALWNARLLVSPHKGRLNGRLGGWQWGMKLMQEMLLA